MLPPLQAVELLIQYTDKEIKALMLDMSDEVAKTSTGFWMTVGGYDDDPRDVWEIPECVDLFKRLVEIGFISLLEVSSTVNSLRRPEWGTEPIPGLGAFEVWAIANGHYQELFGVRTGNNIKNRMGENFKKEISPKIIKEFCDTAIKTANKECQEVIRKLAGETIENKTEVKNSSQPFLVVNPPFRKI